MYVREIDGNELSFGVSGELYNSDLLMYDRGTDSRWDQISGVAVVGPMTGQRMEIYPSLMMTWEKWRTTYPDSEVMSRFTGHIRDYDGVPYRGYFASDELWQPVANSDNRLGTKTPVTGVEIDDIRFAAYVDADVVANSPINDSVGGVDLLVVSDADAGNSIAVYRRIVKGQVLTFHLDGDRMIDNETDSTWSFSGNAISGPLTGQQLERVHHLSLFWFAWVAFHPDTVLWSPG